MMTMTEIEYVADGPGDWVLGRFDGEKVPMYFVTGNVPGCVRVNELDETLEIVGSEIYD